MAEGALCTSIARRRLTGLEVGEFLAENGGDLESDAIDSAGDDKTEVRGGEAMEPELCFASLLEDELARMDRAPSLFRPLFRDSWDCTETR